MISTSWRSRSVTSASAIIIGRLERGGWSSSEAVESMMSSIGSARSVKEND